MSSPARYVADAYRENGSGNRVQITAGAVLFGEYEILDELRTGGMGAVYRARHRSLGDLRAIKVIRPDQADDPMALAFFVREARALLDVQHEAVVRCHDLLRGDDERFYLVMELLDGPTLTEVLRQRALSLADVHVVFRRLASGLAAAHARGVVHRDLAADNVVLPGGQPERAKLIDFGLAKIVAAGDDTIEEGFKGRLAYASPEQFGLFGGHIDHRSDLYSLGLLLAEAASRQRVFGHQTFLDAIEARRTVPQLSVTIAPETRSLIEWLLSPDPRGRPQTAAALLTSATLLDGLAGQSGVTELAPEMTDRRIGTAADPSQRVPLAAGRGAMNESAVPALFERPTVAVLPFENLTGDPTQEYFVDGICEDLTAQLSLFRFLPVIARNSCAQFKSRPVDVKQVRRDLGAEYLVDGSVRRASKRIRVSAQLMDTTTGRHIWAERYDCEIDDLFRVQDEITERIAASIQQQLSYAEPQRVVQRSRPSLDAWELAQRGWWHANRRTRDDNTRAQELFRAAMARDPDFVWAYYGLVVSLSLDVFYQWATDPVQTAIEIYQVSQACVRLDASDPHALLAMSIGQAIGGELQSAIQAAERAVELNPSLAFGYYLLGFHLSVGGDPRRALDAVRRAIWLSPRDPMLWVYHAAEAGCHFALADDQRVIETCERVLRLRPDFPSAYAMLTASSVRLGQGEAARAHLAAMLRAQPGFTVEGFRASFRGAKPEIVDRLIQGLWEAGLPRERA